MVRKPVVAGTFYEEDFEELGYQIRDSFLSKRGPGELPTENTKEKIYGAIIPHAGYAYSGSCMAHAYKAILDGGLPEVFIILSPNHTGVGYNSILMDNMKTPFGEVKVDFELAKLILDKTNLINDSLAHLKEHAVEVHLPYIQFIAKGQDVKIVPIVIGECDYKKLGEAIKEVIDESKKSVCVIASSDFIHYGIIYQYLPFEKNIKKNIHQMDNEAYSYIQKKDSEGFNNFIKKTNANICGQYPILILMEILKDKKSELLCHYNSGDLNKVYDSCVDYMSIVFK